MAKTSPNDTSQALPFVIFNNQLDMMARIMESQCRVGLMMLEASRRQNAELVETITEQTEAAAAPLADFIPSTDDLQVAASAVTKAMNEAAVRAIAHASGADPEAEADDAPVPAQPKKRYKPSISAAAKSTPKKTTRSRSRAAKA